MNSPILAELDQKELKKIVSNLPQSLIIVASPGLDGEFTAKWLADQSPSEIMHITPLDKKTTISVDQIRELQQSVRTQPTTRRVIIIPNAQIMTESASNALLKLIEEPGEGTHFILTANSQESLISTIISRCQIIKLHRTSPSQDKQLLDKSQLSDVQKQQILFLASGRPKLIRELASNEKLFAKYSQFATDAKQLISSKSDYETLQTINKYAKDRQEALDFIDVLVNIIRFSMLSGGTNQTLQSLLERIEISEKSLKSNGNIKLSMMQLAI